MPFFYDPYFYVVLPFFLLALWAQMNVKNTYTKFSKVASRNGGTAAEVARQILDGSGLQAVTIERIDGNLTDHFDPRTNVVRLSDPVYNSNSVAAIGIAAHEVGHAVQHATGYGPIKLRSAIIPVSQLGSNLAMPLIIIGLFFSTFMWLAYVGIAFFAVATFFQVVTLPVEFNASSRAVKVLADRQILAPDELEGTKKVLTAAALTYVAALAVSLANLLRFVLAVGRRR